MSESQTVVSFWPGIAPPVPVAHPETIERLEALLTRAREGNLTAFAYCAVEPGNCIETGFVGPVDRHLMIAAVTILHRRIMDAYVSDEE